MAFLVLQLPDPPDLHQFTLRDQASAKGGAKARLR